MLNRNLKLAAIQGSLCYKQLLWHSQQVSSEVHRAGNQERLHTTFQLMTILEEANHSLIIIEHDPILYEDSQEMVEYISQAMRQASYEATVLLYSPGADPFLEDLAKGADRVFYFEEGKETRPD
jgi:hypothetical protein